MFRLLKTNHREKPFHPLLLARPGEAVVLLEAREAWSLEEGHPGRCCDYRRERALPEMLRPCREVAGKKYSDFSLPLPSGLLLGFPLAETREQ